MKIRSCVKVPFYLLWVVSLGSARKIGQSSMPGQLVIVIVSGIIQGKPVLDVFHFPLEEYRESGDDVSGNTV